LRTYDFRVIDQVGPYILIKLIGEGGMGEVWRAENEVTGREVAIKLLAKHALTDQELRDRFRQECEVAARIRHPNILPVWDYSVRDPQYIVMPFVAEGTDLATILKSGIIAPERAVNIVRQTASALDAAHLKGLRHRDVKPSNIMIEKYGADEQALLFDWGIAQPIDPSGAPPVTRHGHLVGTPAYIAPERLGDTVTPDHRADVYALAVVLYECLTGQKPFDGEDMAVLTAQVLRDPPPLPAHLGPELAAVVAKGLEKDPDKRYQSAGELAAAAMAALNGTAPVPLPASPAPTPVSNGPRITAAGLAGVVVAFGLYLTGTVGAAVFWLLLPVLAAAGALVAYGLWGGTRPRGVN